jgi:CHAT domain-containing protein/tetratricopeptide (TPR) repeat protein
MPATQIRIPVIHEALGGSVIYEEYRGDLARARTLAHEAVAGARTSGSAYELAGALVARAIVLVLQGELRDSRVDLAEVEQLAVGRDVLLRAAGYRTLAAYLDANCFPNLAGAGGAELEARQPRFLKELAETSQRRTALAPSAAPDAVLEAELVGQLLCNLLPARSFTADPAAVSGPMGGSLLTAALSGPLGFEQAVEAADGPSRLAAFASLAAGDLCKRMGRLDDAHAYLEAARSRYEADADEAGRALCTLTEADWLCASVSSPVVLNHVMQEGSQSSALAWAQESRELTGYAQAGAVTAEVAVAYARAEEAFAAADCPRGLAAVHLRRSYLAAVRRDYDEALEQATEAARGFETAGDRLGARLAEAHAALARVGSGTIPKDGAAAAIGDWGRDGGSFSFALGIGLLFAREGRRWMTGEGDVERALACYRLGAKLFGALGATYNEAQTSVDKGEAYMVVGERASAREAFEHAIGLFEEAASARGLPAAWSAEVLTLTSVYQLALRAMDPEGMARSAERLQRVLPVPPDGIDAAIAGVLVTNVQAMLGQRDVLVPLYEGIRARKEGLPQDAQAGFERALDAARRADPSLRGYLEPTVLATMRRYDEAADIFRAHLAAPVDGVVGQAMGVLQGLLGGAARAREEALLQELNAHELAASFFTRVRAYGDAQQHFEALDRLGGPDWWTRSSRPWESLSDRGEAAEGLGRLGEAGSWYERAIAELEERRSLLSRDELKTALSGGREAEYLYLFAARTSLKEKGEHERAGRADEAAAHAADGFGHAERGKARGLLDLMTTARTVDGGTAGDSFLAWREVTARIATWRGLLALERARAGPDAERIEYLSGLVANGEAELAEVQARLAEEHPRLLELINPGAPTITAEEVALALPERTTLLEYFFAGQDLLAWAVAREGIVGSAVVAIEADEFALRIRAFHEACRDGGELDPAGDELSATFLGPFQEVIRTAERLVVVPHGAAHRLPFHVLPFDGAPLGADRPVSYLPSASALRYVSSEGFDASAASVVAVGNPARMSIEQDGRKIAFESLRGAALEAAYVGRIFEPRARTLLGDNATEANVRAALDDASLLHLATHGYLSEQAPMLSSIVLANGDSLTVSELMGLHLDADLVVLSACQTGLGERTGGDDVVGLVRGLLAAGVRAAVVSLWPVGDVSTSLLMARFYARLREGDPPPVALASAQEYLQGLSPEQAAGELARLQEAVATGKADKTALADDLDRDVTRRTTSRSTDYRHPRHWGALIAIG